LVAILSLATRIWKDTSWVWSKREQLRSRWLRCGSRLEATNYELFLAIRNFLKVLNLHVLCPIKQRYSVFRHQKNQPQIPTIQFYCLLDLQCVEKFRNHRLEVLQ
jgi:hypothetical protein